MYKWYRCHIRKNAALGVGLAIILLCIAVIFLQEYYFAESIACYRIKADSLADIADANPPKGRSIFFHETSCSSSESGKLEITARQACAVESAARMNPNYSVYLLYTSPGVIGSEGRQSDRLLKALLSYSNLNINHLDFEQYTRGTPVEELYASGQIERSRYPRSHASDVLRYLTLWKYGGVYLDLDVVVLQSLETLAPNYSGLESEANVAAGVMGFAPTGIGHHFAEMCLKDLAENFSGRDWGNNGPGVITKLLKKICNATKAKDMLNKDCQGFTVYPPEAFYLVPWWNWTMFFDPQYNTKMVEMYKNSFVMHVWNKHSTDTRININKDVPYSIFAKKYCPKVFSECDEYF